MNTAVKQLRYEAGPWLRGGSAFSAASHRCTSSGIPTTILSPLPITPDPRTHLGTRASGPPKTTCADEQVGDTTLQAPGCAGLWPAGMVETSTHREAHQRPIILSPPAPRSRGGGGSGRTYLRPHRCGSDTLTPEYTMLVDRIDTRDYIHVANTHKRWCALDTLITDGFNPSPSFPISRKEGDTTVQLFSSFPSS